MVLVHEIEGGRRILLDPRDAWFWHSRGVALVTVMHLLDDELGHAANNLGPSSAFIKYFFSGIDLRPARPGGLTARGRQAIVELARAGIMVDLSHMAPDAVDDALAVCRAHGIPPVVTHGMYRGIQVSERGLTAAQIIEIYRLGGMVSIPVDGNALDPREPSVPIPRGLERGTMDSFRLHLETLHRLLRDNARAILGRPWEELTDAERTRLAVGWASDWNGWTEHSRPTPRRAVRGRVLEVDRVGLAHPGLLPEYWQRLREDGMDFDPLERSLERFVQIWETVRANARRDRLH
jgi:microsomal dipeptidase-like Zn-dependent dipeptidase